MIDISIVSGTYNRISYLKQMVQSARDAIDNFHYGLTHEFVLVDGNSIDGTQQWIEEQPDCRLIQHDGLKGAVKAFNDGAFAAQGQYVILANDDIQFLDNGIYLAWLYMQTHLDCGVGCFYQDRNRQDWSEDTKWHVETMPVVINGKRSAAYYGQVCIVPKWLGDRVSWWCDENEYLAMSHISGVKPLHTYAGDNELSSRVYELGFKISPIPDAKIHDLEAKDDLRKINNISGDKDPRTTATRGHHPDSWSWGRKWTHWPNDKLCGAVLRDDIVIDNQSTTKDRIVYLPIYEQGWPILKEQKHGLRDALTKVAFVAEYDYVGRFTAVGKQIMMTELMNLISKVKPTLVITQLHNGANINAEDIRILRKATLRQAQGQANTRFINWNGDYYPENYLSEDGMALARAFDLNTCVNLDVVEKYTQMGINSRFWQIGWEPEGVGHQPEVQHDIVFLATGYSQKRQQFGKWLQQNLNGYEVGIYGQGWPKNVAKGENLYNFREACKVYRGAKISLGDSQWPDSGFVSNRVMQALAAGGSALAHQWFRGMETLGLVDNETCIIWRDYRDLTEKINYYLSNEPERQRIASNGEKLALERHSFDARVRELFEILNPEAVTEGSWRW